MLGVLADGTNEADADSNAHSHAILPSPQHFQSTGQSTRTFSTITLSFAGVTVPGVDNIRPGDSLLYLVNAKMPIVVRKVEGSDLCGMLGFAVDRDFADEECEGSDGVEV